MLMHNLHILDEAYEVNDRVGELSNYVLFARDCAKNSLAMANRKVGEGIDCGKEAQKSAESGDTENVKHWLRRMAECAESASAHREDAVIAEDDARRNENEIDVITGCVLYIPDRITLTDAVNAMKEALGQPDFNKYSRARIATAKWVRDNAYLPSAEQIRTYWQQKVEENMSAEELMRFHNTY